MNKNVGLFVAFVIFLLRNSDNGKRQIERFFVQNSNDMEGPKKRISDD